MLLPDKMANDMIGPDSHLNRRLNGCREAKIEWIPLNIRTRANKCTNLNLKYLNLNFAIVSNGWLGVNVRANVFF